MRLLVFFDLPSVTSTDKKIYREFHRFLDHEGFIMVQESVYTKMTLNATVVNACAARVRKNSPSRGIVQMLIVTDKQYSNIEYVSGEFKNIRVDSNERLIII
ncbi:MAG: CRISPR-associated endonuclease Cas2 [Erysipelotrichales bacterium]